MAANGNWTIVFEDKAIIKNFAEGANEGVGYKIDDDAFWNQSATTSPAKYSLAACPMTPIAEAITI